MRAPVSGGRYLSVVTSASQATEATFSRRLCRGTGAGQRRSPLELFTGSPRKPVNLFRIRPTRGLVPPAFRLRGQLVGRRTLVTGVPLSNSFWRRGVRDRDLVDVPASAGLPNEVRFDATDGADAPALLTPP